MLLRGDYSNKGNCKYGKADGINRRDTGSGWLRNIPPSRTERCWQWYLHKYYRSGPGNLSAGTGIWCYVSGWGLLCTQSSDLQQRNGTTFRVINNVYWSAPPRRKSQPSFTLFLQDVHSGMHGRWARGWISLIIITSEPSNRTPLGRIWWGHAGGRHNGDLISLKIAGFVLQEKDNKSL